MDNPSYVALSRQVGLTRAMRLIANNIANISTDGFRRETALFSEQVDQLNVQGGASSQTAANLRLTDFRQGQLRLTGGVFDFAIEGDGFFQVQTPEGPALTRAGAFAISTEGELTSPEGNRLLDEGGAPIFAPAEADVITVSSDGTLSADGRPLARIGVVDVADRSALTRRDGGLFATEQELVPAENATVAQGYIEQSNVSPVTELTRMIDVQRSYEMGQSFLTTEDERQRQAIRVMGAAA